jgi:hypothetical protein
MRGRREGNTYRHSGMLDGGAVCSTAERGAREGEGVLGGEQGAHEGVRCLAGSGVLNEDRDDSGIGVEDGSLNRLAVTRADIDDKAGEVGLIKKKKNMELEKRTCTVELRYGSVEDAECHDVWSARRLVLRGTSGRGERGGERGRPRAQGGQKKNERRVLSGLSYSVSSCPAIRRALGQGPCLEVVEECVEV